MNKGNSTESRFVCQSCATVVAKWQGQCSGCGAWNSLQEEAFISKKQKGGVGVRSRERAANADVVQSFSEIDLSSDNLQRSSTGMRELDDVFGGGLVAGSVILLTGEPGIGKSTLVTQILINSATSQRKDTSILYVAGEESPAQIKQRVLRLSKKSQLESVESTLTFITTTDADSVIEIMKSKNPGLIIVDSIQTMQTDDLSGMAGSIGQLKETTFRLTQCAKELQVPMIIIGHVTKEGSIAGPKVLEHIVDTVLTIEGDRTSNIRMIKTQKNRFGSIENIGLFEMSDVGLIEISDPHALFVAEKGDQADPGSAISAIVEGSRVLLVEVQALVISSQLPVPRRVCRGISVPKLQLISAILQKHCNLSIGNSDIFVNVVGGLRIEDPAGDLAIAMAIASSALSKPLRNDRAYAGEIGLLGEVRKVSRADFRSREVKKQGYTELVTRDHASRLRQLVSKIG